MSSQNKHSRCTCYGGNDPNCAHHYPKPVPIQCCAVCQRPGPHPWAVWMKSMPAELGTHGIALMYLDAGQEVMAAHLRLCSEPCLHRMVAVMADRWTAKMVPLPSAEELQLLLIPNGGTLN